MKIIIQPAVSLDIPILAKLLEDLFTLENDFKPDRTKQTKGLQLIINHPDRGIILVAKKAEEIVGMVNLQFFFSTAEGEKVVLLEDLIVSQNHRGEGIGKLLINEVIAYCKKNTFKRIQLLADKNNISALEFYEKQGFSQTDLIALRKLID